MENWKLDYEFDLIFDGQTWTYQGDPRLKSYTQQHAHKALEALELPTDRQARFVVCVWSTPGEPWETNYTFTERV